MATKLTDYRLLGRSGLRVSPLALGTMTFNAGGSWGSTDAEAKAMVDMFIERGGNFIDTADFYGNMGGSETLLGKLIKGRRDPLVISTKYSLTTEPADCTTLAPDRPHTVCRPCLPCIRAGVRRKNEGHHARPRRLSPERRHHPAEPPKRGLVGQAGT